MSRAPGEKKTGNHLGFHTLLLPQLQMLDFIAQRLQLATYACFF
jgi:hypothetical protein